MNGVQYCKFDTPQIKWLGFWLTAFIYVILYFSNCVGNFSFNCTQDFSKLRVLIAGCINPICSGSHTSVPLVFKFNIKSSAIGGVDFYRVNLELIVICGQNLDLHMFKKRYSQCFDSWPFEIIMNPIDDLHTFSRPCLKLKKYTNSLVSVLLVLGKIVLNKIHVNQICVKRLINARLMEEFLFHIRC